MKPITLSPRSILLLLLACAALLGCLWYFGFHIPITEDLARIQLQSQQAEDALAEAASKIARMEAMEAEIDAAAFLPGTSAEVAPFDNKQAVLRELHGILQSSLEYSLQFSDPSIQADGTVRRVVTMHVRCKDFADVHAILRKLENSAFLCLIRNLSLSGANHILDGPVDLRATIIYLESTKLK